MDESLFLNTIQAFLQASNLLNDWRRVCKSNLPYLVKVWTLLSSKWSAKQ